MKFLCDNCKAKYQIPDEKIAGRTLRMKCRKCAHNIIIRGPKAESAAPAPAPARPASSPSRRPARRRPGSHAGPRPTGRKSALGAEFRRSSASIAPEPASTRPVAEWYVAINDVPVGPIKREEVARKIGTGAVTEDSLCWREGFDDWLPVAQVPELLALMKQRRMPAPPRRGSGPPPAGRSNVVPIGGRRGAAAAPAVEDIPPPPAAPVIAPTPAPAPAPAPVVAPAAVRDPTPLPAPVFAPTPVPTAAPAAAASAAPFIADDSVAAPSVIIAPRRLPIGAWIAIVGAGCFGIAFAVVLANKLLQDDPQPIAQNDPVIEEPVEDPMVEAPIQVDPVEETDPTEPVEETVDPAEPAAHTNGTMRATMRPATTAMMSEPQLTAEQRRQLEQLQMGGTDIGAPMLTVMMETSTMRTPLNEDAVRRVVRNNYRGLQGCYNRAIRGLPDPPDSRLLVDVTVGSSGAVTRLNVTTATDFGGLKACVQSQVRRWRFPSGAGGQTRFPLVFTAPG